MMTFADYMERSLYGPGGYYSSGTAKSGKSGDYFTAPDVGPLFGRLLSEIFQTWQSKLQSKTFALVEAGAGEGRLAADILTTHPGPYFAIEKSASRLVRLRALQSRFHSLEVYPDLTSIPSGPVEGVLFGNELIDAFSVHRVRMRKGQLQEAYVEDSLVWGVPSTPKLADYLDRLKLTLPEDYETEINLAMADWFRSAAAALKKGFVVLIDYGRPAHEYYAPERTGGTLRCFMGHRVVDPFAATRSKNELDPGFDRGDDKNVDWTSDVDFTSAALDAQTAGLTPLAFMEMGTFLLQGLAAMNHEQRAMNSGETSWLMTHGSSLKYLLHPEGLGAAFHVLVLGKKVDPAAWTFDHNRLSRLGLSG